MAMPKLLGHLLLELASFKEKLADAIKKIKADGTSLDRWRNIILLYGFIFAALLLGLFIIFFPSVFAVIKSIALFIAIPIVVITAVISLSLFTVWYLTLKPTDKQTDKQLDDPEQLQKQTASLSEQLKNRIKAIDDELDKNQQLLSEHSTIWYQKIGLYFKNWYNGIRRYIDNGILSVVEDDFSNASTDTTSFSFCGNNYSTKKTTYDLCKEKFKNDAIISEDCIKAAKASDFDLIKRVNSSNFLSVSYSAINILTLSIANFLARSVNNVTEFTSELLLEQKVDLPALFKFN